MVYYNPYITGQYNPLYNPTNQGFFRGSNFEKIPPLFAAQFPSGRWHRLSCRLTPANIPKIFSYKATANAQPGPISQHLRGAQNAIQSGCPKIDANKTGDVHAT